MSGSSSLAAMAGVPTICMTSSWYVAESTEHTYDHLMSSVTSLTESVDATGDRDVEAQLAEIAGVLNVAHACLVEIVEHALATKAWEGHGMLTAAQWLAWRTGVSISHARQIVRIATQRAGFPQCVAVFDAGLLSVDQMAEVVKAPTWADERVVDFAQSATVAQLRRTMRHEHFEGDPDAPVTPDSPAASTAEASSLSFTVTPNHRMRISGNLDLDEGRRVQAAVEAKRQALFAAGDETASAADGLVALADAATDTLPTGDARERNRLYFHYHAENGTMTDPTGWRIPGSLADLICCDALVQPVLSVDGVPVSVGRTQRIVPDRTRRLVTLRDRGCRVPGCSHDRFLEVHHIVAWQDDGVTDTWNLVCLCPKHHRMHHRGELGITGNADQPDGLTFVDAKGRVLDPAGRPRPPTGPLVGPVPGYDHPEGTRLNPNWTGLGWIHPSSLARRRQLARGTPPATERAA
jgi:Domain of unknown function (DUF222)/HNH endonuclease